MDSIDSIDRIDSIDMLDRVSNENRVMLLLCCFY